MKPVPLGRRLGFAAVGLVLIGLGVGIFMEPGLLDSLGNSELGRGRTERWARIISWLWSRPVAVIAGIFGLLLLLVAKNKLEDTRSIEQIAAEKSKSKSDS